MTTTRLRRVLALGGVLGLALAGAGCGGSDDGGQTTAAATVAVDLPGAPMPAATAARVEQAVRSVYRGGARRAAPGLWVGVWDPRSGAFTRAYGEAVRGTTAATPADVWRIGSITKTFTATVVLGLVDDGVLALDDTVAQAAPDLARRFPQIADRTVRQLLGMRSGIPDYINVPDGVVADLASDPSRVFTADELIAAALEGGLRPAGTAGYSSTNFIILQEIAEAVSGTPLARLIAERVSAPLGLPETILPPDDDTALPPPAAAGYLNDLCTEEVARDGGPRLAVGTDTSDWNASYGQGAGGMQSVLTDLGRWGASTVGSALLSRRLAAERLRTTPLPEGIPYGLGIIDFGEGWVGHPGEAIGWQAIVLHNRRTGVTMAFAGNACAGLDGLLFGPLQAAVSTALRAG